MKITFDSSGLDQTNGEFQRRSKLADAAQQFEAMLWQEMLKPMRNGDGGWGDEEKSDSASDTITSFGTEAVAKAISQNGGLGIARQVVRQVSAEHERFKEERKQY
jgi:Rod binding domain-containing protein